MHISPCRRIDTAVFVHVMLSMTEYIEDYWPRLDVINERLCDRHRKLHNAFTTNNRTTYVKTGQVNIIWLTMS